MDDRAARPGDLTCVGEDCRLTGLQHPEGRTTCQACGTALVRLPQPDGAAALATPPSSPPGPGAGGAAGSRLPATVGSRGTGTGWLKPVLALAVLLLLMGVLYVVRNPDLLHRITGPAYKVGDCAVVRQRLTDNEMIRTPCRQNVDTLEAGIIVYQVAEVKKGKDGVCPTGLSWVTFSNEPEATTYCLHAYGMP